MSEVEKKLKEIRDEVIGCQKCPLYKTRTYPVIGEGSHQAKIIFVGEAPGAQEDKTGRPFCGAAGKVLDETLGAVGIKKEEVYICNLLKCRPPQNRDPQKEEIDACVSYLERQIELINPKVVCPLGRHSMKLLMEKFGLKDAVEPISKIHGKVFESNTLFGSIKVIPFYHPAVATYNPNMKEVLKKDFKVLEKVK